MNSRAKGFTQASAFSSKSSAGFTIIELLVVVAIIGLLAGIVVVSIKAAYEDARIARAQGELKGIAGALIIFENDTKQWPGHQTPTWEVCGTCAKFTNLNNPDVGLVVNDSPAYPNWKGPYINGVQLDPWGNNYFFDMQYDLDFPNLDWAVVLGSFGGDGALQGGDDVIHFITR